MNRSKGQSAIEYLTTYGWMILAVAVVSGVAYSSIQSGCTRSFSDFYTDAINVQDFGLDGNGNLLLSVENERYSEISFNSINITLDEDDYVFKDGLNVNISSGSSDQLKISGFRSISGCNTLQVNIFYDKGNLQSQKVTGIIRAPIGIK